MDLAYEIKRSSKRHKLTISVERDCSVIVHAPIETSLEVIEATVQEKRQWIYEKTGHAQKYKKLPHPPGKELVNGETAPYLGKNYQIELVNEQYAGVQFDEKFLISKSQVAKRKETLRDWYITKAKEKILPKVDRHAQELGVNYSNAKIVDSRYRWGSCTVKNNINLNWRLIKAPMFVIDYMIVHELAHLIEPNHTPRFWNIVRTKVPTMEKAKLWLKEHGQLLEEDI